jgi:hypothetical protein
VPTTARFVLAGALSGLRPGLSVAAGFLAGVLVACGTSALDRPQAADLLARSPALARIENMTIATPGGCFTLPLGASVRAEDVQRDERLSARVDVRDALRRERELELVDFVFEQAAATSPSPLEGCEQLWASVKSGPENAGGGVKLVAWKTILSDKAMVAGLQAGQTFQYRRQTLVAITALLPQIDGATVVGYSWKWAPTYEGAHLGIRESEPISAQAVFRKSSAGWQVVP